MIQLHGDALWFQTTQGEAIPCSVEAMAFELVDGTGHAIDADLIRNAAKAVLHYFRHDLGRTHVTVGDFAQVFATVLRGFGFSFQSEEGATGGRRVAESDLRRLAADSGEGLELIFFSRLRAELRRSLAGSPRVVRFQGLRGCVKHLAGARRWNRRCQQLHDQIVAYLRDCLGSESRTHSCALIVQ
jgi:hypothetical protein